MCKDVADWSDKALQDEVAGRTDTRRTDIGERASPPPYEGVYIAVCKRTRRLYKLAHLTEAIVQDALLVRGLRLERGRWLTSRPAQEAPCDAGSTCYSLRIILTSLLLSLARLKQAIAEHRDVLPEATDQWCDHHLPYVEAILLYVRDTFILHPPAHAHHIAPWSHFPFTKTLTFPSFGYAKPRKNYTSW